MSNSNSFGGKLKKVLASMCSFVVGASGVSQAANSMVHSFIYSDEGFDEAQYIEDLKSVKLGGVNENIFGQAVELLNVEGKSILLGIIRDKDNGNMKLSVSLIEGEGNKATEDLCIIPFKYFAEMWWNYTKKYKEGDNTGSPVTLYDWGRLLGVDENELKNLCYIGPEKKEAKGLYGYNDAGFGYVKREYMDFIVAAASGNYGFLRRNHDGYLNYLGNVIKDIAAKVGVQNIKDFKVGEVGENMQGLCDAILDSYANNIGNDNNIGEDLKNAFKDAKVGYDEKLGFTKNFLLLIGKYDGISKSSADLSKLKADLQAKIKALEGKSPWGKVVGTGLMTLFLGGGATAGAHMIGLIDLPTAGKRASGKKIRRPKNKKPPKFKNMKVSRRNSDRRAK